MNLRFFWRKTMKTKLNSSRFAPASVLVFAVLIISLMTLFPSPSTGGDQAELSLSSDAFAPGGKIPSKFTCEGEDVSPPLRWRGVPAGCVSLVLIVDDPDAPGKAWAHWVLYNIGPSIGNIAEGTNPDDIGAVSGINDFKTLTYRGPCPPGGVHHYRFTLYALGEKPDFEPGLKKGEVLAAIENITIDSYTLIGTFSR